MKTTKDLFIEAHEEAIAEYLDRHPDSTWEEAYDRTAHRAEEIMADRWAARIDDARMRAKYE